jgi:HAD superfamily hydrolase (TIGR01509 family)
MARPRGVLFDIGGTLWSSPAEDPGALAYCYGRGRELLLGAGITAPGVERLIEAVEGYFAEWEEIWRADAGRVLQEPTTAFVAQALARIDVAAPPDALAAFTDAVLQTSVYTARALAPEPDMSDALAELSGLGLRLACVSNAFMSAITLHAIMAERGLAAFLELTVSSCDLGFRKPHPAIYRAALDRLDLPAAEAIFVGDRLDADVEGPAALGMRTVLTRQYRQEDHASAKVPPDHVIDHLRELASYIRGLL